MQNLDLKKLLVNVRRLVRQKFSEADALAQVNLVYALSPKERIELRDLYREETKG